MSKEFGEGHSQRSFHISKDVHLPMCRGREYISGNVCKQVA